MTPRRLVRGCVVLAVLVVGVLAISCALAVRALTTPLVLAGHTALIPTLAFSPKGRLLASGSHDKSARLWDLETGRAIHVLDHPGGVEGVAFTPDGDRLGTACDDGKARIWSVATGQLERTLETSSPLHDVAFSPGGDLIAVAGVDGRLLVSSFDGRPVRELKVSSLPALQQVAFAPGGRYVGDASNARTAIWSLADGALLHEVEGGYSFSFSPDGAAFAVRLSNGRVRVISLRDGSVQKELLPGREGDDTAHGLAYSSRGTFLGVGQEACIRIFSPPDGALLGSFEVPAPVIDVAFSPDEELCAVADNGGSVTVWRTRALELSRMRAWLRGR